MIAFGRDSRKFRQVSTLTVNYMNSLTFIS